MITRKYYEKNNGYKYVLSTLKGQFGEETTISMVEEAVSKCNALCKEYAGLPKKEKVHTEQMIFPRATLYMQMIRHMPREQAIDLLMEAIRIWSGAGYEDPALTDQGDFCALVVPLGIFQDDFHFF